jgi:hypothetical protein
MARYLPYSDGCPRCLRRGNLPADATPVGRDSMLCHYRCAGCGHLWRTSWSISAVEGVYPEPAETPHGGVSW